MDYPPRPNKFKLLLSQLGGKTNILLSETTQETKMKANMGEGRGKTWFSFIQELVVLKSFKLMQQFLLYKSEK